MIKIHLNNREGTINSYVTNNLPWISARKEFFQLIIRYIHNEITLDTLTQFNNETLHSSTRTSFVKLFISQEFIQEFHGQSQYNFLSDNLRIKEQYGLPILLEKIELLTEEFINEVLTSEPDQLLRIERQLYTNIVNRSALNTILSLIFDYSYLRDKSSYNISTICIENEIKSCPYCNFAAVSCDDGEDEALVSVTSDHFYDQSTHPLLSISLFNLIPVCFKCNTQQKNGKPFTIETHVHPYIQGFGNHATFISTQHSINNRIKYFGELIIKEQDNPITRQLVGTDGDDLELIGNVNVFKLKKLYKTNLSEEIDIIHKKCAKLSNAHIASIRTFLDRFTGNGNDIYRDEFINYLDENEFQKKDHSKFYRDIIKERLEISNNVSL